MTAPSRIVTGAEYVTHITARESDRRYRQAFQRLALRLIAPGGALFDFGSGPGIDVRFYAEHGLSVQAYDIDAQMSEYLAGYCREFLASGRVTLHRGGYREFLAGPAPADSARVGLVTANFAPLNLIDDLQELFARFDALTAPEGAVLASVLSPYYAGDLRYGWWWRNAARLLVRRRYAVRGAQALIWRRRLADFAAQCAPCFRLEAVYPGTLNAIAPGARGAWLPLTRCRFMFLLFRKPHPAVSPSQRPARPATSS
jgi:SAM-dependent methyltransferase